MRTSATVVLLSAACWLSGCGRAPPPAHGPVPPAAFAGLCMALPPARYEVAALPIAIATDDTRSRAELTAMHGRTGPDHRTLGLTEVHGRHSAQIDVEGLADGNGHACFRAHVRIELTMSPLTVFVARELAGDPCRREAVEEHERKHVAVYTAFLAEESAGLERELPAALGNPLYEAADAAAAQRAVQADVAAFLDAFAARGAAVLQARQDEVDSVAEYARVGAACGGL